MRYMIIALSLAFTAGCGDEGDTYNMVAGGGEEPTQTYCGEASPFLFGPYISVPTRPMGFFGECEFTATCGYRGTFTVSGGNITLRNTETPGRIGAGCQHFEEVTCSLDFYDEHQMFIIDCPDYIPKDAYFRQ